MEQDTTAPEGAAFEPRPMIDILRSDAPTRETEPAGRQATEAPPAAPAETGEAPAAQPKDDRPRDEAGRFAPKAAAPDTGPPPEAPQNAPQTAPIAAVLEERKKRQALERELQELRARVTATPPAVTAPPPPADVPLDDLMFQDPSRFVQAIQAPLQEEIVRTRIAMSEAAVSKEPDLNEAMSAFTAHLEQNPQVKAAAVQALRSHPDPARWALEQGRALMREQAWGAVIQEYGSPEAFLAARAPQPQPAPPSAPPAPPASLASARSAGPRVGTVWSGPTPLSAILGPRR